MATTTISDYVIWTRHIHGDAELTGRIHAMWAGQTLQLEVDGVRGVWRKMDDGADGRPTPGIRPIGAMQVVWRSLYKRRRGEAVIIRVIDTHGGVAEAAEAEGRTPLMFPAMAKTEAEREAAFQQLMNAWKEGHSSDGRQMTRDEMHER